MRGNFLESQERCVEFSALHPLDGARFRPVLGVRRSMARYPLESLCGQVPAGNLVVRSEIQMVLVRKIDVRPGNSRSGRKAQQSPLELPFIDLAGRIEPASPVG